jgi:AraC-like DNA-binding protein
MTAAARLLRETDGPLSAVARRCGYASEFAFAKAFKREFAVTPGAFRRAPDPQAGVNSRPELTALIGTEAGRAAE